MAQKKLIDGIYTTSDGLYSVTIIHTNDTIILVEPNKTSYYLSIGNNTYKFINTRNGIEYRIEILDSKRIASFKPQSPDNRTIITYNDSRNGMMENDSTEYFLELAQKYLDRIADDPDNVQIWAFCSAAATVRAMQPKKVYETNIKKDIRELKAIMVDNSKCPCEDVVTPELWKSAGN